MSIQGAAALTEELEALVEDYRHWLVTERSLVPSTVKDRVRVARLFLAECGGGNLKALSISKVIGFVVNQSSRLAVKTTAKTR